MKLRYLESLVGLEGPLQTAIYLEYAVFKEHYAQLGVQRTLRTTGKDLKQVTDLKNMVWLFDGKGSFVQNGALDYNYLKTAVKQALQQNIDKLKSIPAAKANQLLDRDDLADGSDAAKTALANAIISHFDDLANFKKVFFIE